MTHPITPPPELVRQLIGGAFGTMDQRDFLDPEKLSEALRILATRAAQYGADQELEACCGALDELNDGFWSEKLRAARRPKPQTLNSIALQMLGTIERDAHYLPEITDTIRRALEALPE